MAGVTTVSSNVKNVNFNKHVEDVINGDKDAERILGREVTEYVKEKESELTFWQSMTIFTGIASMGTAVIAYFVGRGDGRSEVLATLPPNQAIKSAQTIKKTDEVSQRSIFHWW